MKFGPMSPAEAIGAIAVHSIRKGGLVLRKGTRLGEAEAATLQAAGIEEIVVARTEPGDVAEDAAAADIAAAVAGEKVRVDRAFTGRANLFASDPFALGMLVSTSANWVTDSPEIVSSQSGRETRSAATSKGRSTVAPAL